MYCSSFSPTKGVPQCIRIETSVQCVAWILIVSNECVDPLTGPGATLSGYCFSLTNINDIVSGKLKARFPSHCLCFHGPQRMNLEGHSSQAPTMLIQNV